MKIIALTLIFFAVFLNLANAGDMFKCIDQNGNTIFTDLPKEGMNCNSNGDGEKLKDNQNDQYIKSPSRKLNQKCIQELESSSKYCKDELPDKSYLKQLSPNCLKMLESHNWPAPNTPCSDEIQKVGQAIMSKMLACRDRHMSTRCSKYFDTMSKRLYENSMQCTDKIKKISRICGMGQKMNEKCYKNHHTELEAACSD